MRARARLLATLLALLLPAGGLAGWRARPASELPNDFTPLPRQMRDWQTTRDETLEPAILEQIAPDAYVWRRYEAPGRPAVNVYAAVYTRRGGSAKGAHDPRVCFPSQGWDIQASRSRSIPMDGGESLLVQELEVEHTPIRELVLYWFQPSRRWGSSLWREELLRIRDAALGRPQYAFVRLSAPLGGGADVQAELVELSREVAIAIRSRLDSLDRDGRGRL